MKKIITLVLAMLMLVSVVACAKEAGKTDKNEQTDTGVEKQWIQKDLDYDGYVFNIMSAPSSGTITNWDGSDIDCEEISGHEVLDKVYYRNRLIEQEYNCKISWVDAGSLAL